MLINLWVKDKETGDIHQLGTDVHDSVEFLDGQVVYVNMQSCTGTLDGDYEWVEPPDTDDYISVTPEQLFLNRQLIHQELMKVLAKKQICERLLVDGEE